MESDDIQKMGEALLGTVIVLEELLRRHEAFFWADQLTRARTELERGDLHGAVRVQNLLGRDALSDLTLKATNGHRIDLDEEVAVNASVARLTSTLYILSRELARA